MDQAMKPTITVVPGAWHRQIHVQPLLDILQNRGYKATCIELATAKTEKPRPTWNEEVSHISGQVFSQLNSGLDVCLVLHSYAGQPGLEAVNRLVQGGALQDRKDRGRLAKVVFFAAHHFPTGYVVDNKNFVGPENPHFYIDDNDMSIFRLPRAHETFFNDVTDEKLVQPYVDALKEMYYIPGGGGSTSDDWRRASRLIVGCSNDQAIKPEFFKQLWAEHMDEVIWIDCDHSPFLTKSEQVADVLTKAFEP